MKKRAGEEGHNAWLETITALEEVEGRLGQVEAECRELRSLWSETESKLVELRAAAGSGLAFLAGGGGGRVLENSAGAPAPAVPAAVEGATDAKA